MVQHGVDVHGKNIVACLDATSNRLKARGSTNVVQLFGILDLSDPAKQVEYYDPGARVHASVRDRIQKESGYRRPVPSRLVWENESWQTLSAWFT